MKRNAVSNHVGPFQGRIVSCVVTKQKENQFFILFDEMVQVLFLFFLPQYGCLWKWSYVCVFWVVSKREFQNLGFKGEKKKLGSQRETSSNFWQMQKNRIFARQNGLFWRFSCNWRILKHLRAFFSFRNDFLFTILFSLPIPLLNLNSQRCRLELNFFG